jgi:hypothetical protein
LAANTTPRRGITVSDVRIIPVEYSDVIVSAPSAAMTSWPKYRPSRLRFVGSKYRPLASTLCAAAKLASAPMPMVTTTSASSVTYVDRVERILVSSDRSAPPNPARASVMGAFLS